MRPEQREPSVSVSRAQRARFGALAGAVLLVLLSAASAGAQPEPAPTAPAPETPAPTESEAPSDPPPQAAPDPAADSDSAATPDVAPREPAAGEPAEPAEAAADGAQAPELGGAPDGPPADAARADADNPQGTPAVAPAAGEPAPPAWAWAKPVATAQPLDTGTSTDADDDGDAARLSWRGTALLLGHSLTTSALGVGRDYQSDAHQVYVQSYALRLQYHLVSQETFGLSTDLVPEVELELTDSAETTRRNEPWLLDLPWGLNARYALAMNEPAGSATWVHATLGALFPLSKASRAAGHILTLSPRLGVVQELTVFGKSAPLMGAVSFGGFIRYDHLWSEATTPVDEELDYPGQSLAGGSIGRDLLDGSQLSPDRYRLRGFVNFAQELLGRPLGLELAVQYESAVLSGVSPATLELATGPHTVSPDPDARTSRPIAGVGAELDYGVTRELSLTLGYANRADLDSETPNLFYSPAALFVGMLTVSLDQLYLRLGAAERAQTAVGSRRAGQAH